MHDHLISSRPHQTHRFFGRLGIMTTVIQLQNVIIHALNAQLQLGHTLTAQFDQMFLGDQIGSGLDHQSNIAMLAAAVPFLHAGKRNLALVILGILKIERLKAASDEPLPIF